MTHTKWVLSKYDLTVQHTISEITFLCIKICKSSRKVLFLHKTAIMKRFFLPFFVTFWAAATMAAPVTMQQALQKARQQIRGKQLTLVETPTLTAHAPSAGKPSPYYIFNAEGNGGYVIISGDDLTEPVLGYSEEGNIIPDRMPENMKAWLEDYAQQIEAVASHHAQPARVPTHASVQPLLTCKWDQTPPYNRACPTSGGEHCVTGCVATAMAQVMYYHKWPQDYTQTIPEYTTNGVTRSALDPVKFNWSAMRDTYTSNDTDAGATAVATLMHYCGRSVKMGYDLYGSEAQTQDVAPALINYFDYDKGLHTISRGMYTMAEWDAAIYEELAAQRPVVYSGASSSVGHAFVCDGYDGKGNYHINWGWGGAFNGYFKLSILNSDGSGVGGSSTNDGYTFRQYAVIGVQKSTGQSTAPGIWMESSYVTANGTSITFDAQNNSAESADFELGLAIVTDNGLQVLISFGDGYKLDPGWYYSSLTVDATWLDLSNGTYKVVPVSRVSGTSEWRSTLPNYKYVEVVVNGDNITCTAIPKTNLTGTLSVNGNLVVNSTQEVEVNVENKSGEFYAPIYLFASKTTSKGSVVNKTQLMVEPEATGTAYVYFTPNTSGVWNLWVTLDEEGEQVLATTQVTIGTAPTGQANLEVTHFKVTGNKVTAYIHNKASEPYCREIIAFLFDQYSIYNIDYAMVSRINIQPDETIAVNFTYDGLTEGEWYQTDLYYFPYYSENDYKFLASNSFIYTTYQPGDVNHDGQVNVSDIMAIVNYILGSKPAVFYEEEANVNNDTAINVSDIMAIVNIILNQ